MTDSCAKDTDDGAKRMPVLGPLPLRDATF
jgi:hypothetical protein